MSDHRRKVISEPTKKNTQPMGSILKIVEEYLDDSGRKEERTFADDGEFFDYIVGKWFVDIIVVPQ